MAKQTPRQSSYVTLEKSIEAGLKAQLKLLGPEVRTEYQRTLQHLYASDRQREISLLPYYFAQAIVNSAGKPIDEQLCVTLGIANINGWVAYTIYDDFLDEEADPSQLAAANVAHRQSLLGFLDAVPNPDFQQTVKTIFNSMDEANAWETTHCRFATTALHITIARLPHFGNRQKLAERSLGHTLSPLAVLASRGFLGSADTAHIERALRHFLIVRQLNDDAHDWKEDLRRGHITYVVTQILKDAGIETGQHPLPQLIHTMERQFWRHTLADICRTMKRHIRSGLKELDRTSCLQPNNILRQLLLNQAKSVEQTLTQQMDSLQFLQKFRGAKTKS